LTNQKKYFDQSKSLLGDSSLGKRFSNSAPHQLAMHLQENPGINGTSKLWSSSRIPPQTTPEAY
jgi:hypothetical protein